MFMRWTLVGGNRRDRIPSSVVEDTRLSRPPLAIINNMRRQKRGGKMIFSMNTSKAMFGLTGYIVRAHPLLLHVPNSAHMFSNMCLLFHSEACINRWLVVPSRSWVDIE